MVDLISREWCKFPQVQSNTKNEALFPCLIACDSPAGGNPQVAEYNMSCAGTP